ANSYPVSLAVTPTKVTVSVNGNTVATVPLSPESGRPPAGGFELTGQREHQNSPVPEIEHLTTS
ncbi:MAG: hypothetical protein J2O49_11400, partial [Sciscionella sp.]|nr:hypothetical protein [Sciscionella sp.]